MLDDLAFLVIFFDTVLASPSFFTGCLSQCRRSLLPARPPSPTPSGTKLSVPRRGGRATVTLASLENVRHESLCAVSCGHKVEVAVSVPSEPMTFDFSADETLRVRATAEDSSAVPCV